MAASPVTELQDLLDRTANDSSLDPPARVRALRMLRSDLTSLIGQADTYIGDNELRRDAGAMQRNTAIVAARENADVRDNLLARGLATPEQLDAAGYLSHADLDSREADGTLEEMWLVPDDARQLLADWKAFDLAEAAHGGRSALIAVDVQKDFIDGSLGGQTPEAVKERESVVKPLLEYANSSDVVVASRDWHPPNHISFSAEPQFVDGSWPPHAVQDTEGAQIDKAITDHADAIVSKGDDPATEAYSAFDGTVDGTGGQSLADWLRAQGVDRVVVGGLATDYCVRATALDAKKQGFDTHLATDAIAGVAPDTSAEAVREMGAGGVKSVTKRGWGDMARKRSLEVRRAAAAARDIHEDWGAFDSSRGLHPRSPRPLRLGGVRTPAVDEALGPHADTREKYAVAGAASPGVEGEPGPYTAERKEQHRKWIEALFKESGATPQPEGERHVTFVAGGPASGKSSADEFMPKFPHSVEIDQDYFKNQIDEFRKLAEVHDPYASDAAHREAADVAHAARLEAMRRGYNVVVQGTGDSGPGQFAGKMVEAKKGGYHVHAFYVSAPTDVAMGRAQGRAKATGRAVPEEGLRAMHANVSKRFDEVAKIAPGTLDSLDVYDSREDTRKGGKARRVLHLDPKARTIVTDNPRLEAEFREKANEDPGTLIREPSYV